MCDRKSVVGSHLSGCEVVFRCCHVLDLLFMRHLLPVWLVDVMSKQQYRSWKYVEAF